MDKYLEQLYEYEGNQKTLSRLVEQYRVKNVELEREKFEAMSGELFILSSIVRVQFACFILLNSHIRSSN